MLETERLRLRQMTLDDAALMLAVWNDPAFVRHVGDRGIRTIPDAEEAMQKGALHLYEAYGYGPFRISLKGDDTPVGICGLFRRDGLDEPDIGYSTLPDHCGRGYAYEAAVAVVDYSRDELALDRLIAIISPGNDASIGLIRKLGFEFERMHTMPGDDREVCVYGKSLTG
ncbi:MAG: GNAT family N-acetyltransferase [Woeseiaceae bacterium]